MNYKYDLNELDTLTFVNNDEIEFDNTVEDSVGRLTDEEISNMPDEKRDVSALRCSISSLFHEKFKGNYALVETECDIKENTFRRVLRQKNSRNVTYVFLAKFCVGAKVGIEKAKELFQLMGHELSETNRYDYILLCELKKECDITEYDDDLKKYGFSGVFSEVY